MKKLNFEEACRLFGRKNITLIDEKNEPITTWGKFFLSEKYFVSESSTVALKYLMA